MFKHSFSMTLSTILAPISKKTNRTDSSKIRHEKLEARRLPDELIKDIIFHLVISDNDPLNIYERLWLAHNTGLENYSSFLINQLKKRAGCYNDPLKEKIELKHWGSCGDIAFMMGNYKEAEKFYLKKEWHDVDENDRDIYIVNYFGLINMAVCLKDWDKTVTYILKAKIKDDPADDRYFLIEGGGCSKRLFIPRVALAVVMSGLRNTEKSEKIQKKLGISNEDWEIFLSIAGNASYLQIEKEIEKARPSKKNKNHLTLEEALSRGNTERVKGTLSRIHDIIGKSLKFHQNYKNYIFVGHEQDFNALLDATREIPDLPNGHKDIFLRQRAHVQGAILIETFGLYNKLGITNYNKIEISREYQLYQSHSSITEEEPFYILHLKSHLNELIIGADIFPCVTKILRKPWLRNDEGNKNYVEITLDKILSYQDWVETKLDFWLQEGARESVLSAMLFKLQNPQEQDFIERKGILFINDAIKFLSLLWKEEMQFERWKSENELYELIKAQFKNYDVRRHATPLWLGRQHLDIFIEELRLAIEYQGKQHYEPISIFGGQEAFKKNVDRDMLKQKLCQDAGVILEYVRYDDNIKKRVKEIIEKYGEQGKNFSACIKTT